jgi:hypothetical protein
MSAGPRPRQCGLVDKFSHQLEARRRRCGHRRRARVCVCGWGPAAAAGVALCSVLKAVVAAAVWFESSNVLSVKFAKFAGFHTIPLTMVAC